MNNAQLEKIIGYRFKNSEYLDRALTHSSFNREKNTKHKDNERMEFLGDAFLDAIISVELFHRMSGDTEGKLTKTRALIVCEKALADASKDSILADAAEAVIGAVFLDGGYEAARRLVLWLFEDTINEAVEGKIFLDYKSVVQEVLQSGGTPVNITYLIDSEEGPAHDKTFYVHMECNGKCYGSGSGKSKKEAEQNAARQALNTLKRGEIF